MINPVESLTGTSHPSVPELFASRARQSPQADFLKHSGSSWTYAEALDEIRRVAGWLTHEAGSPERVATYLDNCPEALWAWLGTLHAGATHVALHRGHRGLVLADMIERSQAEVLVTDGPGLARLPDLTPTHVRLVMVVGSSVPEDCLPGVPVRRWDETTTSATFDGTWDATTTAGVIYTSGTTGRSKAVAQPHSQLTRGAGWVAHALGLEQSDVLHLWLPLYHVAGQLDCVLAFTTAGASLAMYPRFSRSRFWEQVAESGATVFGGFANVFELLDDEAKSDAGTLRIGIGGAIPPDLHERFRERFGIRIYDVYGMTEAEPLILPARDESTPAGSCGRPSPDFEIELLGPDERPVARGDAGEIVARPRVPGVMTTGYEGDSDAWSEVMRDGWFHTGDLARQDNDGFFYFVDRLKHSIRRHGENVSSWELEHVISKHPAVAECCAVGVPSPLGDEDIKVVLSSALGHEIDESALLAWCADHMAKFMLPRYIEVVNGLPRNAVGKLDKERMRGTHAGVWDAEST